MDVHSFPSGGFEGGIYLYWIGDLNGDNRLDILVGTSTHYAGIELILYLSDKTDKELFIKHKEESPYKMIICGDFNNTAFSYVYKEIKGNLKDAFKIAGNGFGRTYDFKFFPVRIDFIFANKELEITAFKTFDNKYSDHYPIFASFKLH